MHSEIDARLAPLADRLRRGSLSLAAYLADLERRFELTNVRVQAFLPEANRFERLSRDATALAARYPQPGSRPPLYGVAVGIKDIFRVDGFPTRAGSRLPPDLFAGPEAETVTQLKNAGALILGKTITTEFAYFAQGPTRNPRNLMHTPGGSSSGSAAAVAAGLCPLALGTQTFGSILRPAAFCGVVGFKPSHCRVSGAGVIPFSVSIDQVGFLTRDLSDAALAAAVLCTDWRREFADAPLPSREQLGAGSLVLAVPSGPYLQSAGGEALGHFEEVIARLRLRGFRVESVEVMTDFDTIVRQHVGLGAAEAAIAHAEWYCRHAHLYHPTTTELIERGRRITAAQIETYRAGREALRQEILSSMAERGIDAWISPAAVGPAPEGLDSTGDPIMSLPWTFAGVPAVSVPSGFAANGLPLGLQIVAGWKRDEVLLWCARAIAEALGV
jgi:Asp-tRNA(Asn)/Glu-tRNA(Gln) amidotransferase A subunit family amidase